MPTPPPDRKDPPMPMSENVKPRTIWKFDLAIHDRQVVPMPAGADIVSVQPQGDMLCLWAVVAPGSPLVGRDIRIVGTGNPMPAGRLVFIATVQEPGLWLVWHVSE